MGLAPGVRDSARRTMPAPQSDRSDIMLTSSHDIRQMNGRRCAVCGGKFGLVRHYRGGTGVCSRKCRERLSMRQTNYIKWLFRAEAV